VVGVTTGSRDNNDDDDDDDNNNKYGVCGMQKDGRYQ
jgi:hypothetical protein